MGKIRLAAGAGQSIPGGWAVDAQGQPTTDPAEAIKGMLLPAAGPKGFGLAFVIDLLCGGLSDVPDLGARRIHSKPSAVAAALFAGKLVGDLPPPRQIYVREPDATPMRQT